MEQMPFDAQGNLLQQHQLFGFRAVVSNQSIATRDAVAVRYAMDVPTVVATLVPVKVTAGSLTPAEIVRLSVYAPVVVAAVPPPPIVVFQFPGVLAAPET